MGKNMEPVYVEDALAINEMRRMDGVTEYTIYPHAFGMGIYL